MPKSARQAVLLLAKDLKVLLRSKTLLVLLMLYPIILAGIVGLSFSDSSRPPTIGFLNKDIEESEVFWRAGDYFDPDRFPARIERLVKDDAQSISADEAESLIMDSSTCIVGIQGQDGISWFAFHDGDPDIIWNNLDTYLDEHMRPATFYDANAGLRSNMFNVCVAVRGVTVVRAGTTIRIGDEIKDSDEIIKDFTGKGIELKEFQSEGEAVQALNRGETDALLIVPPGFVSDLRAMDRIAEVRVLIDESNLIRGEIARAAVEAVFSRVSDEIGSVKVDYIVRMLNVLARGGEFFGTDVKGIGAILEDLEEIYEMLPPESDIAKRIADDIEMASVLMDNIGETRSYLSGAATPIKGTVSDVGGGRLETSDIAMPILLTLICLWTATLAAAVFMSQEEGTLTGDGLRVFGFGAITILSSKCVMAVLLTILQAVVIVIFSTVFFSAGSEALFSVLFIVAVSGVAHACLGLMMACSVRDKKSMAIVTVLVTLPMLFMSGAIFPVERMASAAKAISYILPVYHTNRALSMTTLRGSGLLDEWIHITAILIFAAACFVAAWALKRSRELS